MALNEVETGELYKFEKPSDKVDVQGVLKSYKEQPSANGIGHVYEVRTKNGVVPFFAPTILHDKLEGDKNIGNVVQITYTELGKTNSGNDLKLFKVLKGEATEENLKLVDLEVEMEEVDEKENIDF